MSDRRIDLADKVARKALRALEIALNFGVRTVDFTCSIYVLSDEAAGPMRNARAHVTIRATQSLRPSVT